MTVNEKEVINLFNDMVSQLALSDTESTVLI